MPGPVPFMPFLRYRKSAIFLARDEHLIILFLEAKLMFDLF